MEVTILAYSHTLKGCTMYYRTHDIIWLLMLVLHDGFNVSEFLLYIWNIHCFLREVLHHCHACWLHAGHLWLVVTYTARFLKLWCWDLAMCIGNIVEDTVNACGYLICWGVVSRGVLIGGLGVRFICVAYSWCQATSIILWKVWGARFNDCVSSSCFSGA